ncbi:hypothetical protein HK101_009088 [Irineochytrium annulatum]|nr:hypothetical protein HK101_009088 [Irineochytrium annulatum]
MAALVAATVPLSLAVLYANLPSRSLSLLILASYLMLIQVASLVLCGVLQVVCPLGYDGVYTYLLLANNATMAKEVYPGTVLDVSEQKVKLILALSVVRNFVIGYLGTACYSSALGIAVDLYRRVHQLEDHPPEHAVLQDLGITVALPLGVTFLLLYWELNAVDHPTYFTLASLLADDFGLLSIAIATATYTTLSIWSFFRRRKDFRRLLGLRSVPTSYRTAEIALSAPALPQISADHEARTFAPAKSLSPMSADTEARSHTSAKSLSPISANNETRSFTAGKSASALPGLSVDNEARGFTVAGTSATALAQLSADYEARALTSAHPSPGKTELDHLFQRMINLHRAVWAFNLISDAMGTSPKVVSMEQVALFDEESDVLVYVSTGSSILIFACFGCDN